jgi:hypothetical protein
MIKVCTKCKEEKSIKAFYEKSGGRSGVAAICIPCHNKISKEHHLKSRYGLTIEQLDLLFEQQGGRCAICFTFEPGGRYDNLHIDHDHNTGVVRGLLCASCNLGIGYLKDSTSVLKSATSYLERFKCE